jgi:hypothetical protein
MICRRIGVAKEQQDNDNDEDAGRGDGLNGAGAPTLYQ